MDADEDVTLKDVADIAKEVIVDAEIEGGAGVQGRQAESQAQIYQIGLEHANKVLSMQDDEVEPAELQEVVEVVTTGKLMIEIVTAASATVTAATTSITTARKEKKDNAVMRYQALKRKPQTEAQARKNMMIYLRNMAGFKMDYFKGISYDHIRPIFEKKFNSNVAFLEKTREQMEEKDSKALKRTSESQAEKIAKKQKLDEEVQNDTGYNVFANDLQHFDQSKSINNTCIVETSDSNVIPDSPDMCDDDIQNDQNDVECDDEHSQIHNNIMAAGSRDHPMMLAIERYTQWRSRFLRYIDTRPNGDALRKCILNGPYIPTTVVVQAVAATDDSPAIPEHTTARENIGLPVVQQSGIQCFNCKEFGGVPLQAEKYDWLADTDEEIDEQELEAHYSYMAKIQESEWSRFVTIVKQQHKLDEVSYHKLFEILKQYQNEVNELHTKKLARNANPLALAATAQADQDLYYQTSRSHRSSAPSPKPSIPSRSHTTTRHKGKEIAKPITPPFKTASEEDINPEQAQRDKDMQKNLALIAKTVNVAVARENVGSKVVQQSGIQCFNCKEYRHFPKECRKTKRVKDSAYHKEKTLLCKQAEQGVPLQAEQYDWLADTDEEVDEQELEAHYSYMAKIQEVTTADSGTDSEPVE
nr:hypothetical protein [Tanacetum cinerariifolium]